MCNIMLESWNMKERIENRKENLISLIRPMQKENAQLELMSFAVFVTMFLYAIGLLVWNCVWSELLLRRNVDWMNAIISLLCILFLHKFQPNLNHSFLYKYRCVNYILFYTSAVLNGNKYTMCLVFAMVVYTLTNVQEEDIRNIKKIFLGTALLLEMVGVRYIYLGISKNGFIGWMLQGIGIDILLVFAVALSTLSEKRDTLIIKLLSSSLIKKIMCVLCGVVIIVSILLIEKDNTWSVLKDVLKTSIFQDGILILLLLIAAFRPWRYKITRICNVRQWQNYLERIFMMAGVLLLLLFGVLDPLIERVAERRGLTSKYTTEDFFNGNIVLKGFEIGEDGTLISLESDPWITVYRKEEFENQISRIVLDVGYLSNEEVAQCYVFQNEDNWAEGVLVENYQMQQGKSVIKSDILRRVDRYVRLDLTAQEGTEIKLNRIQFDSYSSEMIWIAYLGIGCMFLSVGILIKKTVRCFQGS